MVNAKDLFQATRKKIIGLILIGTGGAILLTLFKEWFMKLIASFTTPGTILVSLIMIIIGIYLNLKREEDEKFIL